MSATDPKKRIGREFIQLLLSKCNNLEAFEAAVKEFASDSAEKRVATAMSLVAIGADPSERAFDRNFSLAQVGLFARTCGLKNSKDLQDQLSDIIDDWMSTVSDRTAQTTEGFTETQTAPWGALSALGAVNQHLGLQKCDDVIRQFGDSESGRQVRIVRTGIERLKPSDS